MDTNERLLLRPNFPYAAYSDLQDAGARGEAIVGINKNLVFKGVALVHNALLAEASVRFVWKALGLLPFVATLAFCAYLLFSQQWLLLVLLPVFFIGYQVFHPATAAMLGPIRSGLILGLFTWLAFAVFNQVEWAMCFTLALTAMWFTQTQMHKMGHRMLIKAACLREDVLSRLWQAQVLFVQKSNGSIYWVDFKRENEQTTFYDQMP